MENMVIGIEGYVGAGKSAICKELLHQIPNSILLEGGNLYRAIVYALTHSNIDLTEIKQHVNQLDIKEIMDKLEVKLTIENNITIFYIDGKRIEEEKLQSAESSLAVSQIGTSANNQNLYLFGRQLIDNFKKQYNVIVSGRDLMNIYPNLNYHFLITASLEERIKRKSIQYGGKVNLDELRKNIVTRDALQEKAGYYKTYDKTITVDVTDCENVIASTQKVLAQIAEFCTKNKELVAEN